MNKYILPGIICLLVATAILKAMWYGIVSIGYFISDYWALALAILFAIAAIGVSTSKQKTGLAIATIVMVFFQYGDGWYVTDTEKKDAHELAVSLSDLYNQMGLNSVVEGNATIVNTVKLPTPITPDLSSYEDTYEEFTEKLLERTIGPKVDKYEAYRLIELKFRKFHEDGGEIYTIVKNYQGQDVFKITVNDLHDFTIDEI
ncbi:hypothetical protein I3271_06940 [Photobacterium leiognathi]|uniref:hypothetical protein n=1 Tax=Photobacterium leiognathi TaxID=553611 RepID=UPI001EDD99C5|nr:hypothetical protein [Photobacterium leiognathi]MCG3884421.1 hypothetical protein [Photobacterium leiognathi]